MYRLNLAAFTKLKRRRTKDAADVTPPSTPDIRTTLPTEIQIEILSYLHITDQISCSRVCKQWETLILESHALVQSRYTSPVITKTGFLIPATHKIFEIDGWLTCTFKGYVTRFRVFDFRERQVSETQDAEWEAVHNPNTKIFSFDITNSKILDELFFSPFNPPEQYDEIAAILDTDEIRLQFNQDQHTQSAYGPYGPYGAGTRENWLSERYVDATPWSHSRAALPAIDRNGFLALEFKKRLLNQASMEIIRQLPVDKESKIGVVHPWLPDRKITVRQVMEEILAMGFAKYRFRSLGLRASVEYEVKFWNNYFPESNVASREEDNGVNDQEYRLAKQENCLRRWWPTASFHHMYAYHEETGKLVHFN
ncbi:hypothetical protein TWF730_004005 [Orbilia blumenaviensis]|uniref:F-box domain-containing protein n=1 Tax=Orbilia blumenaviensis TaxID=1796055 RepID=A0AAV9U1I9_9PEZI